MSGKRIILITGVSCSGKTTLQDELISRGWTRPINFTTRAPRSEEAFGELLDNKEDWNKEDGIAKYEPFDSVELDEYVFLSDKQFMKKLANGDFLENTNSYGNRYGVSKTLPKGANVCIILDPVGRSQVLEYFSRLGRSVESYYVEIGKELQLERLEKRGDNEKQILMRKRDFEWFSPTNKCIRLNGAKSGAELADIIEANGSV